MPHPENLVGYSFIIKGRVGRGRTPSMSFWSKPHVSKISSSSRLGRGVFLSLMVKLGSQIVVFYVCREHILGIMNLLSSLGRMWVSCHHCFIVWGYVLCSCCMVLFLGKLAWFCGWANLISQIIINMQVVVVQLLSCVWLFATPWTVARQASLSFIISRRLLEFVSVESVMQSNYLILCRSLLLLPSIFPSIRDFSNVLALLVKWLSIGASVSTSVLSMNIQGWFLLGLTGLILLQSQGLSKVFRSLWYFLYLQSPNGINYLITYFVPLLLSWWLRW